MRYKETRTSFMIDGERSSDFSARNQRLNAWIHSLALDRRAAWQPLPACRSLQRSRNVPGQATLRRMEALWVCSDRVDTFREVATMARPATSTDGWRV